MIFSLHIAIIIDALEINQETGILGAISNPRYSSKRGKIRFSGFPFIGSGWRDDNRSPQDLFAVNRILPVATHTGSSEWLQGVAVKALTIRSI